MLECLHLEAKSCPLGGQGCGRDLTEEGGGNLMACMRNRPGLARMLFFHVMRQWHVLQSVLKGFVSQWRLACYAIRVSGSNA